MKHKKILIVEDEVLIAEDLKDILLSFGVLTIEMAHKKSIALKYIETFQPDLVLLDIRMEKENDGLEIGNHLFQNTKTPFIYITAHSDVAMVQEIIKTSPAGYITKPIKKSDLFAAISLALGKTKQEDVVDKIKIKDGYSVHLINTDEILYIESEGNYINIYCENKKYVSRQSLDSIIKEMTGDHFFRIQRSYLVNISKITRFSKKEVFIGEIKLPVSRNLGDELEKKMSAQG